MPRFSFTPKLKVPSGAAVATGAAGTGVDVGAGGAAGTEVAVGATWVAGCAVVAAGAGSVATGVAVAEVPQATTRVRLRAKNNTALKSIIQRRE